MVLVTHDLDEAVRARRSDRSHAGTDAGRCRSVRPEELHGPSPPHPYVDVLLALRHPPAMTDLVVHHGATGPALTMPRPRLGCCSHGRYRLVSLSCGVTAGGRRSLSSSAPRTFAENRLLGGDVRSASSRNTPSSRYERRLGLAGTQVCFEALRTGAIDVYPEYTGTGLVTPARTIRRKATPTETLETACRSAFLPTAGTCGG